MNEYQRDLLYCPKCKEYAFFGRIKDNKIELECMHCHAKFDRKWE